MLTLESNIIRNRNLEAQYSAEDFVNPESFDSHDTKQKAYVLLNGGFVIGIVFAEYLAYCEQDALDEAVDRGKLDAFQVTDSELDDYQTGEDSEGNPEYDERLYHLGNASEPFDIEALDVWLVSARMFAEDTALMTYDRVMTRLEDRLDIAEKEYQACDVYSEDWSRLYKAREDLADAKTLLRFAGAR